MSNIYQGTLGLIGNTPLVELTHVEKMCIRDSDYTVDKLKEIIARLRSMSPLYEDFVRKTAKQRHK